MLRWTRLRIEHGSSRSVATSNTTFEAIVVGSNRRGAMRSWWRTMMTIGTPHEDRLASDPRCVDGWSIGRKKTRISFISKHQHANGLGSRHSSPHLEGRNCRPAHPFFVNEVCTVHAAHGVSLRLYGCLHVSYYSMQELSHAASSHCMFEALMRCSTSCQ